MVNKNEKTTNRNTTKGYESEWEHSKRYEWKWKNTTDFMNENSNTAIWNTAAGFEHSKQLDFISGDKFITVLTKWNNTVCKKGHNASDWITVPSLPPSVPL